MPVGTILALLVGGSGGIGVLDLYADMKSTAAQAERAEMRVMSLEKELVKYQIESQEKLFVELKEMNNRLSRIEGKL